MMPTSTNEEDPQGGQGSAATSTGRNTPLAAPKTPEPPVRCPRCDSTNTKFCYYNNYSLSQPRHFCKSCRRYWTRGGALRNVPIGGGSRKSKKLKPRISYPSSPSTSRLISSLSRDHDPPDQIERFRFLDGSLASNPNPTGFLSLNPAINPSPSAFLYNNEGGYPHLSGGANIISLDRGSAGSPFIPFHRYNPLVTTMTDSRYSGGVLQQENAGNNAGSVSYNQENLASSIESLSSLNQDLHWRLQQQRLAMLYGTENQKEALATNSTDYHNVIASPSFVVSNPSTAEIINYLQDCSTKQNMTASASTTTSGGGVGKEWLFGDYTYSSCDGRSSSNAAAANEDSENWPARGRVWGHDLNNQQYYASMP